MIHQPWFRYALCISFLHIIGIILIIQPAIHHPSLLGLAFLAYTFGLRHAFDIDHIAAIDNAIRKLVHHKKAPVGVGFFFSLGHSTIVAVMTIITAFSIHYTQRHLPQLQNIGSILGSVISGAFLIIIGCINLFILIGIYRVFVLMRNRQHSEGDIDNFLLSRGFIARVVNPLLRLVTKEWHMYPIGFLFGLGFDTSTEVSLLVVSALAVKSSISFVGIVSLPILFAAGMSLLDTADGIFMTNAYQWAFTSPLRKIYYNLSITGLGVLAAIVIGLIELAHVFVPRFGLHNSFWNWISGIDFSSMGYILIILFIFVWIVSFGFWKLSRIEEHWKRQRPGC